MKQNHVELYLAKITAAFGRLSVETSNKRVFDNNRVSRLRAAEC